MADVFVDLWGVLADSRKMTPAYRQWIAEVLRSRHGGSMEAWLRAHDAAEAWYEAHMANPKTWEVGTWIEVVNRADAEQVVRMFRETGAPPPPNPLGVSKTLTLEGMSKIDSAFPDARPAVARLRKAGHRVFVATNATEENARGALAGAKLLEQVDGVITGEIQNSGKTNIVYWRGIVDRIRVDPAASFVADDRPEYLRAAAQAGFRCLLIDREGRHPPAAMPPFVEATLRNLAGLPQYIADAVRAARVRA
jgi:FMN phosphatase YigB (HAD superfamily)